MNLYKQQCRILSKKEILLPFTQYFCHLRKTHKKGIEKDNERLENMVKESLIKEFGPQVKDLKSYNLLVDAVVHNLKKKQLKSFDDKNLEDI